MFQSGRKYFIERLSPFSLKFSYCHYDKKYPTFNITFKIVLQENVNTEKRVKGWRKCWCKRLKKIVTLASHQTVLCGYRYYMHIHKLCYSSVHIHVLFSNWHASSRPVPCSAVHCMFLYWVVWWPVIHHINYCISTTVGCCSAQIQYCTPSCKVIISLSELWRSAWQFKMHWQFDLHENSLYWMVWTSCMRVDRPLILGGWEPNPLKSPSKICLSIYFAVCQSLATLKNIIFSPFKAISPSLAPCLGLQTLKWKKLGSWK